MRAPSAGPAPASGVWPHVRAGESGPAGPARALASGLKGPRSAAAVTSEISPSSAHRTSRVPCASATCLALAQAPPRPSLQWSAAASAARSAAPPARCLATTTCDIASNAPKTTANAIVDATVHTVAEPRSRADPVVTSATRPESAAESETSHFRKGGRAGTP